MLKFSFPIPVFVARWLWPDLVKRAEAHGRASASKRSKGGIIERSIVVETVDG